MGEEMTRKRSGALPQADKNGIADLAVDSEAEAFEAIRRFLPTFRQRKPCYC